MPPKLSLNGLVSWQPVLKAIGNPAQGPTLPARATCPACQSVRLTIFPDQTSGGQWYYCPACKISGELIELAARTWQLSYSSTLLKLATLGLVSDTTRVTPTEIAGHEKTYLEQRQRWLAFWAKAQDNHLRGGSSLTSGLVNKLGLRCRSADRFQDSSLQLFGIANKPLIEQTHMPGAFGSDAGAPYADRSRRPRNPGDRRIFKGANWTDVLCFPYYDLPGRLSGFLFVGREGGPDDMVYRAISRGHLPYTLEMGLAMHPQAIAAAGRWDNRIIAFNTPVLPAKIQIKQLQSSNEALPLVAWHDQQNQRTRHGWNLLRGYTVVLWCETLDCTVVRAALKTNGLIAYMPRGHRGAQYWIADAQPDELCRTIFRAAKPWAEVLSEVLLEWDDSQIEELFLQLKFQPTDFDRIVEKLSPEAGQRVQRLFRTMIPAPGIVIDNDRIVETDEGWFREATAKGTGRPHRELICDATFRIEETIYQQRQEQVYYRGYVQHAGEKFPFCERREQLEKHTVKWLQTVLLENRHGLLQYGHRWRNQLMALSARLHKPDKHTTLSAIGWDAQQSQFVLANYAISLGGEIRGETQLALGRNELPAQLPQPKPLSLAEIQSLTQLDWPTKTFWATQICVLGNVLGPIFDRATSGIGLIASPRPASGPPWGFLAGCPTLEANTLKGLETLLASEQAHGWPVTANWPPRSQLGRKWVAGSGVRNALGYVTRPQAAALSLLGGWHLIHDPGPQQPTDDLREYGQQVLPNYLQDLAERRLEMQVGESWLDSIALELAQWVENQGADPAAVLAGRQLIYEDRPAGHTELLGQILAEAAIDGEITLTPPDFAEDLSRQLITSVDPDGIFLSRNLVHRLLSREQLPEISTKRLGEVLRHAGLVLGEEQIQRAAGWWLPQTWWQTQLQAVKVRGTSLRLLG